MKLIVAYLAQTFFLSVLGEKSGQTGEHSNRKLPFGFEDEMEIPHARLAHFPAQIGHWRISSRVANHNR
jgi:hypothetical protein